MVGSDGIWGEGGRVVVVLVNRKSGLFYWPTTTTTTTMASLSLRVREASLRTIIKLLTPGDDGGEGRKRGRLHHHITIVQARSRFHRRRRQKNLTLWRHQFEISRRTDAYNKWISLNSGGRLKKAKGEGGSPSPSMTSQSKLKKSPER